jgi:hypothetical protein
VVKQKNAAWNYPSLRSSIERKNPSPRIANAGADLAAIGTPSGVERRQIVETSNQAGTLPLSPGAIFSACYSAFLVVNSEI